MPHTNYHNGQSTGILHSNTSLSFCGKQNDAGSTARAACIEGGMLAKYAVIEKQNLHLPQLFLPEGKAADAICHVQVANNDRSCGVTPEKIVQEVSLIFSCCVPDLQADKGSRCYHIIQVADNAVVLVQPLLRSWHILCADMREGIAVCITVS